LFSMWILTAISKLWMKRILDRVSFSFRMEYLDLLEFHG
jgi:hypothetical protein